MKTMWSRVMVAMVMVALAAVPAAAQQARTAESGAEVGVGFVLLKWADYDSVAKGIGVDFAKAVTIGGRPNFSVVGDVTFAKDSGELDTTFGGGVRYTLQGTSRVRVHFQGLLGVARWSVDDVSDSAFFIAPGAGVTIPINDRVDFRGQVDIFVPNWDDGNLYRFFFGVAFQVGR